MARKIANKSVDLEAGTVTFDFNDGQSMTAKVAELPKLMQKRAMLHGIAQKIGDAYSGAESAADAHAAAVSALQSIMEENWNVGRQGGEGSPRIGKLVKALARAMNKSEEEAQGAVDKLSDEEKKGLRTHPLVKKAMVEINAEEAAEKAAKVSDASDLSTLLG